MTKRGAVEDMQTRANLELERPRVMLDRGDQRKPVASKSLPERHLTTQMT
jgi:hypothetical protein